MWDVRAMENVHTLSGHTASISSIHFSENGYLAATGDDDDDVFVVIVMILLLLIMMIIVGVVMLVF